ncbi:hypothetical protein [Streptomyces sp. NBC_01236]|uniref:hypothetical protein n=1 Tax=Streptomyces sp. NBC_01236 TaxID=2903789 RepID=UPI002E0EC729|nr:hypothetical protein OG324_32185 [Streptomyces sp. NBC_01236]
MSDANVVGRVAVKVMPDTSGFKDDLKEKLKKIEHDIAVTIRTKADPTGARKDVLEAVRSINNDNKKTDTRKIRFYTRLDLSGMSGEVTKAVREYQARANQHRITFSATGRQVVQEARRTRRQADAELSDLHLGVNLDNQGSVMTAIAKVKAALVALGETDIEVDLNEPSLNAAINMFEDRLDEIGHIDLRVDKESKASVQAAVAEIERELQKLAETNLKVKLDQASLEEAKRDLLAQSRQAAQATADEIQQDLDAIRIRPKLDEQKVAQVKRQLEASFEQMHNLKAQITPELDALAKRKVERDIDDLQDKIDKLKSEIEPEVSRTGVLAVLTHMAILTRNRVVDIIPKVNASAAATAAAMLKALSGARVIGDMFEHLGDVIKNLDKSAPIIGTLATAIAGLGASGIAATSNLAALSSSLASIAPTALLLPGLLGGMAVGLGVSIAAFKDFNKVVPEVKSALHGLQDTISENFWAKAAEPIRAVVDDLLPKFTAGVSKTATELGGFFGSFATNLGTSLSPALDQMFKDLSDSIGIATQGTDTFASIIATLGKVGTSYLPSLADWFVRISENFDAWLKKKGDNGLKDMIDQGIQALKDLGSILADTGGILAGFSRAATAAGGSTLGTLADSLDRIHKTVDSEGFQKGMTDVFAAAHEAMQRIADTSGPAVENLFKTLGSLLTTILPQVGSIIGTALGAIAGALSQPAMTDGIKSLFDGIQAAVTALAPAMAPLGQALGALLSLVGAMLTSLGPLVASILTPLSQAFTQLAPAIEPLIGLLGEALGGVVAALAPLLMTVVEAVTPLIEALVAGLAPVIPLITEALSVMSAALQPVIEILMQILTAAIMPLIPVIQQLAAEFLPQISEAFAAVMEAVQPLLEALLALVNFLMPILAPAIQFIAGLFLGALVDAIEGVADVFTGLKDIFVGVWDIIVGVFKTVIGFFKGTITGDWSTFGNGLKQIWNGLWTFLSGLWNTVVGAFKVFLGVGILGAGGKLLKGIGEMFKAGWTAVKTICLELWASLTSRWSTFLAELKAAPGAALSAIAKFFSQTWADIRAAATVAWDAVKNIFKTKVQSCVDFVKELPGKVKSIFSSAKSLLVDAGKKIITGLIDGLKSMFSSVKSTLGDLTSKLTDWKGPAPKDAKLLYNAGQLIIKGLIKGLESQYDNVKTSLNELTAKIPKNASKGLKERIAKDRAALLKLAAQWESVGKKLEAARDNLDKIREEAANYRQQIADTVIGTGDVTKIEDSSFTGISSGLKNAVEQAKKFAAVLKRLKDLGLNSTTFDQIASAGPEAGLAAAEAIANAGLSGVSEINDLQAELEKYANKAGSTASHYMYDAGIQAAEGLVKGLEAQQDAIEKQMLKIADAMVAAIKKALDIHSPSRLFRKLGSFVGKGFGLGVEDQQTQVERATNALAASAVSRASGQVTAAVSGGLPAAGSGQSVTKVLNYYAGSGSSLSSEEELFSAASRARMVGW